MRIPPPPHDYQYYWVILDPKSKEDKVKVTNLKNLPKLQIFDFWNKFYTRHTFWSCLMRCANMNGSAEYCWRYRADTILSTDGRTDRQGETGIPLFNFVEAGGIINPVYKTGVHLCGCLSPQTGRLVTYTGAYKYKTQLDILVSNERVTDYI